MEDARSAQVHAVEATRNTAGPRGSKRTEFEAAAASGRGASRAALDLGEYEGELPIACDEFTLDVTQSYGLCVCGAPRAAHRDQNARPRSGSGGAVARLVARHEAHIREARAEALRALAEADALALERNAARARAPRLAHARAPAPDTVLTSAPLRGAAGGGRGEKGAL